MGYDIKLMTLAIQRATENVTSGNGGPFGAVIAKNGKVISTGVNSVTSDNDPTAHAEVIAIREACKKLESFQLDGCEIYASCEPCPMCLGAIYWARPDKLYFAGTKKDAAEIGFDDSFIYEEINIPYQERKINTEHVEHPESLAPFNEWKNKEDKIEY
ncbi:MAG: nucleoside deaminase [Bacteroidota bacterium]